MLNIHTKLWKLWKLKKLLLKMKIINYLNNQILKFGKKKLKQIQKMINKEKINQKEMKLMLKRKKIKRKMKLMMKDMMKQDLLQHQNLKNLSQILFQLKKEKLFGIINKKMKTQER